ncbi:MAG: VWA domain-containing protein [Candidatus Kapaibacterium sp.]|nr:VWA domain-containing protein [Bacteroidota bacterium]
MKRFSVLVVMFAVLCLSFTGCPQTMVEQVEKMIPPKGYKPVYMSSGVSLKKLQEQYQEKLRKGLVDSTKMYDEEAELERLTKDNTDSLPVTKTNPSTDSSRRTSAEDTVYHKKSGSTSLTVTMTGDNKRKERMNKLSDSLQAFLKSPVKIQVRSIEDKRYPDSIEIRTSLTDTAGRFITGLAPPRFIGTGTYRNYWNTLFDSCNGTRSEITDFTVTEVHEDANDKHAVSFVIDHSGSMGDMRIQRLREAVRRTMGIVKRGDMISVIPFAGGVTTELPLTSDTAEWRAKFNVDKPAKVRGGTSIYDAVDVAAKELAFAPANYKRAIILLTDGEDNTSKLKLEDACRKAREKNVAIYAISYGVTDEEPLEKLTQLTSGRLYRIYSTKEFPYVFADIYQALKNYYRITYHPPKCSGIHYVQFGVRIPEYGVKRVIGRGTYDKSLYRETDTVGSISFVNIEFETGKAVIRKESLPLVERMADVLSANPTLEMEIRGHTDNRGSDDFNMKLSEQRAIAVVNELERMGIDRRRLTTRGFGATQPLTDNDTEINRAKNRRTEFVVVKK